jgi:uridylate kinase
VNPDAKFFEEISYDEVISKNLKVMDQTAVSLAKE